MTGNGVFLRQDDFKWWLFLDTMVAEMLGGSLFSDYKAIYKKWFGTEPSHARVSQSGRIGDARGSWRRIARHGDGVTRCREVNAEMDYAAQSVFLLKRALPKLARGLRDHRQALALASMALALVLGVLLLMPLRMWPRTG